MPMFGELDVDAALSFACETADHARSITRRYFRQPLEVQRKADFSPVTQADRECELMIRQRIKQAYPTHGILGEEHGREGIENDFVWVLDPIDGTKSFISGNPLFGTMICLLHRWQPVLSIVDIPMLDERWTAVSKERVALNDEPCAASKCTALSEAIVYTTSIDSFDPARRSAFDAVSQAARLRRFGGDCYSYGLLASGFVDVVFGASLEPYDFLPLGALVESAGGIMTDWSGNRLGPQDTNACVVASATPALHAEILALLQTTGSGEI
jgi:inositol-phosphate phosphatase/L-galactose 1-phosphate phosphatase/histidinol-phosphatase